MPLNRVANSSAVRFATILFCCAALLTTISGCGNGLARVSGEVTLDGELVKATDGIRATVYFNPADPLAGASAVGLVDEKGRYHLSTGAKEGIVPGEYNITFNASQLISSPSGGASGGKRISPPRYATQSGSGLQFTVEPGSNTFDLVLTTDH